MMEKEPDDAKSKTISAAATAATAATATGAVVSVRIQPFRATKVQPPALVTGVRPQLTNKPEEMFQRERIKKFGYTFGVRFNNLIVAWQNDSKPIRQFFLDGSMARFSYYGDVLKWNNDMTALVMSYTELPIKDHYNQLLDLDAFWNVMTKGPLDTFKSDTVLYRGVRLYPGEQLPDIGYVVQNVLTNWTSDPRVAGRFANTWSGAFYAATFPKGTKYFYTGENKNEFEYIIPGGTFQLQKYPRLVATYFNQIFREYISEKITLLEFTYIPSPGGQSFQWPSKSTSPSTRAAYQQSLETKVLPDLVEYHLTVTATTTLPQIIQQFETLKKRTGYTGLATLLDYGREYLARIDHSNIGPAAKTPEAGAHVDKLIDDFASMQKAQRDAIAATATSNADKKTIVGADFMDFKIGGAVSHVVVRFQPRVRSGRMGGDAQQFRDHILELTSHVTPPRSFRPYFFLKLGPPSSGKSTIMKLFYDKFHIDQKNMVLIDVDAFVDQFTAFPAEAKEFLLTHDKELPETQKALVDLYYKHRNTINDLVEVLLFQSTTKRLNVEFESTGSLAATKWILTFLPSIQKLGYIVVVVYPYVVNKILRQRLDKRNKKGSRQVTPETQLKLKDEGEHSLLKYVPFADHVYVVDNNSREPTILTDLKKTGNSCHMDAAHHRVCKNLPKNLPHALAQKLFAQG